MSSPHSTLSQESFSNMNSAFRLNNSSGNGFDPLWAGPNATNVPKEAITVDDTSPDVVFSNPSTWSSGVYYSVYRRSVSYTTQAGASLSFSFDGIAIWYGCVSYTWNVQDNLFLRYYGSVDVDHGFYAVAIDGSEPERLSGKNDGGQLTQQMIWSKTDLTPGRHIFTLKHDDLTGNVLSLDFFRSATSEAME